MCGGSESQLRRPYFWEVARRQSVLYLAVVGEALGGREAGTGDGKHDGQQACLRARAKEVRLLLRVVRGVGSVSCWAHRRGSEPRTEPAVGIHNRGQRLAGSARVSEPTDHGDEGGAGASESERELSRRKAGAARQSVPCQFCSCLRVYLPLAVAPLVRRVVLIPDDDEGDSLSGRRLSWLVARAPPEQYEA